MAQETYQAKYQNIFYPGSNPTINQDCEFTGTVIQGAGQASMVQHFTYCRSDVYLKMLWQWLCRNGYIAKDTNCENFVYVMGGNERPSKVTPVVWTASVQVLREMLETVYEPALSAGQTTKADIEKTVPLCFSKDGKPLSLAKNRQRGTTESKQIMNFLATLAERGVE